MFINTESKGLDYKNAEKRGEHAYELFKNVLEFETVEVCENFTKAQVEKKIKSLKDKNFNFQKVKQEAEKNAELTFKLLDNDKDGTIRKD